MEKSEAMAAIGAFRSVKPVAFSTGVAPKETLPARSVNGEVGWKCVIPDLLGPDVRKL